MPSTLKSRLKVSLISLIVIFSLVEASPAHPHESYSHDGGRQTCQTCWMKYLKDDVLLSELSIPGTHETMSFYGGDILQTQSMALHFQLESGIRVLDIRCAVVENGFNIYHGNIYQRANFDDVLKAVVDFLETYPHETVLMRVKEENTSRPERFRENFEKTYWNRDLYKKYMWKGKNPNPTLGEIRGKIVILQDFARKQCDPPSPKPDFGICYNSFKIQDEFVLVSNFHLYEKWEWIKAYLALANTGDRKTKYMNYLSAGRGAFPYFVVSGHSSPATGAPRLWTGEPDTRRTRNQWINFPRLNGNIYYEGTNTLTYGAMRPGGEYTKRVGIIMTDFPGWGLINRIIDLNKDLRKPNFRLECDERNPTRCLPPPKRPL